MEVLQVEPQTNEQHVIEPVSPSDLMRIITGDRVASFAAIFHWDVVMGGVELGGRQGGHLAIVFDTIARCWAAVGNSYPAPSEVPLSELRLWLLSTSACCLLFFSELSLSATNLTCIANVYIHAGDIWIQQLSLCGDYLP